MIARYNNLSLLFGIPGFALQVIGKVMMGKESDEDVAGSLVLLLGSILLITGLCPYAKAKARHPAWGLMGLFSLIGIIVLAMLEDRAPEKFRRG